MHVRRLLALALAGPVLLAGCSDDAAPTPKMPEPSTSSSTPTPTESETPEAESPEDFIRRWAALEAEMENSGDTTEYMRLSARCDSCKALAETIEGYYGAGGSVHWAGWTIHAINGESGSGRNAYSVDVTSGPTRYKESASAPTKRLQGGKSTHLIRLAKSGASWVVVEKTELAR
jgi:hypothetical protein